MRGRAALFAVAMLASACGSSSEPAPSAINEPIRVRFQPNGMMTFVPAQFFPGPLPGGPAPLAITFMNSQAAVFAGEQGKKLVGNATIGSSAVGLKFKDIGSGYWVVPVGFPDSANVGTDSWELQIDFGANMPLGNQLVQVAAVSATGEWGPTSETSFYVNSTIPSGAAVASLTWDSNADLDLQIVTGSGQIDAKHVGGGTFVDGGFPPGAGVLDHDSNAFCVSDGRRRENVVWATDPPGGTYLAKVDMFSACGEPAANFLFQVYVKNEVVLSVPGQLIAIDADNGMGPGLFITNFSF